nr:MAG TPA: hypothetical protein [Caudoviricetes sp.]
MKQIGVIMFLIGTAGILSIFGIWIYKEQKSKSALLFYILALMVLFGGVMMGGH